MIRILIVDDQKSVRENIKLMLSAEPNFEIVGTAENGYEGMRLAETLVPDVILMDLEMPKFDGLTTTRLISQKNPTLNIIILTIKDQDKLLIQALNAGARGYLLKSSEIKEIVNTINLVYDGNKLSGDQVKVNTVSTVDAVNTIDATPKFANDKHQEFVPKLVNSGLNSSINSGNIPESNVYLETLGDRSHPSPPKFSFTAFLSVLKRRYPPALMGFFGVLLGAALYLAFAKRAYQATSSIVLQNQQESVSELGKDLSSIGDSKEYSPLASQVELIQSKSVLKSALKYAAEKDGEKLRIQDIPEEEIEEIQGNLEVSIIPNTNIIEVSYIDYDPKYAATLLNEIVSTFKRKNADNIRAEASSVKQFLEKEVAKQKSEVDNIKSIENDYRQEQGIVSLDNQTNNLVNNLDQLETQQQELLTQIKEQESKANNLEKVAKVDDAESGFIAGKIGQDRQLEELRGRLIRIEAELAEANTKFTESNPTIVNLEEEKENITGLLQQRIDRVLGAGVLSVSDITQGSNSQTENGIGESVLEDLITNQIQLDADREKLQVIQADINRIQGKISLLPAKVQSLTDIVRQQEQASESLQFLQRKLEEARIAEAQLVGNFQIVEEAAVPISPHTPNTIVVMAIASFLATALMMAIILLLERIDRTLYNGQEVEQHLDVPFLTALPSLSGNEQTLSDIISFLNDRTLYEPYRFLLKRLESHEHNRCQTIVVTSATAEEGKSTVASHLGAVSAMLSKRTLIIDAHLHSSKQHHIFKVQNQPGLKEVATRGLNLTQAVQPTKIRNLSVLASGSSTADSWMILESPQMKQILQEASFQYDLIIIDTPPVNDSCDAYTLSKYSSGLMMVTRPFHTPKDVLEKTVLDLKRNNASIIGFVINNADKQKPKLDSVVKSSSYKLPALSGSKSARNSRQDEEVRQP